MSDVIGGAPVAGGAERNCWLRCGVEGCVLSKRVGRAMSGDSFALAHELSLRNEAKRAEVERLRAELQQLQVESSHAVAHRNAVHSRPVHGAASSYSMQPTLSFGQSMQLRDSSEPFLDQAMPLSVVIFGATGDLAKKKLFPALYQLILLGHFPRHVNIVGVGRREVEMEAFLKKQLAKVQEDPRLPMAEYKSRISFHAGGYDSPDAFAELHTKLSAYESSSPGNRLFFLSVPPTVFGAASEMIAAKARAPAGGFTHLIIEKPFGKDTASFNTLNDCTASLYDESQLFRIDHYLGKEVIQNILSLRFANQLFENSWDRHHIESVQIIFKEDIGTGGRGGYFDGFGIIRDIMQNHLLQVFMLVAMEFPAGKDSASIAAAKVKLLEKVQTLHYSPAKAFLGEFAANSWTERPSGTQRTEPGYLDDPTVPEGSRCPTFASVVLEVDNDRWRGVPFLMQAGKGLDERKAEVRVRFKPDPRTQALFGSLPGNELVMRIQPNEACYLTTYSKEPGLGDALKSTKMEMAWATEFPGAYVGDAYEKMLLSAAKGDGRSFVGEQELVQAWRIFTPLLHEIDATKPMPTLYPFNSEFPPGFEAWSATHGVAVGDAAASPEVSPVPTPRPSDMVADHASYAPSEWTSGALASPRLQSKMQEVQAAREELRKLQALAARG
jgi:glucose-6-phosphate 1-dehydrogenase